MQGAADRPLTVLISADAVGGVWTYALSLIAGLPQIRFVLAVMGPGPDAAQRRALDRLPNAVLETRSYRLEWMQRAEADLDAGRDWVAGLAQRYGVDLAHINGYAHAQLDSDCPVLAVAHSDVLSWWTAVHGTAAPPAWEGYRDAVIAGLSAADRVVAPTRAVLDDLRRHYGLPLAGAVVIVNGIDVADYAPAPKHPVVLAAGRVWDEAKNLALLDMAARDLAWPVEIAGDPAHPERGAAGCANAQLLGRLPPEQLRARLANAAIFAAPALYEPFGLGILEAAASGCALVLGDIASLRESWDGAALFVDPSDPADISAVLRHLIGSRWERRQLAASARRRAASFSRERMAARYAALYRELLGDAPSAGEAVGKAA